MNEEETKEPSNQIHNNDSKQNKKKKKRRHKKANSINPINPQEKKEESNIEIKEACDSQKEKEEPNIELKETCDNKENIEIKEEIKVESVQKENNEQNKQEESQSIIKNEDKDTKTQIEISVTKTEEIKEEKNPETKEETQIIDNSYKKTKGKKRKKHHKKSENKENIEIENKKEEINEENKTQNEINSVTVSQEQNKSNNKDNINIEKEKGSDMLYPEKDIDPNNLINIDEDDGEINYLNAEQAYELSVLLESHKFIRNGKNIDKKFINLIRRQIIRYERNLYELSLNDNKFFILYEISITKNTDISILEIMILDIIKYIMNSYPEIHLIIFISNNEENSSSLSDNYKKEKLSKILLYLNIPKEKEKNIHIMSSELLIANNELYEKQKNIFINSLNKQRVQKLFKINSKEKEENNEINIDYPCSIALVTNASIYTKYIPEITSEHKCLIINSIFYIYKYLLCFHASKILNFPEPSIIALKVIPPLQEENMIFNSDERQVLSNKIKLMIDNDKGINLNWNIFCQYLSFLMEDDDMFNKICNNYDEGKKNEFDLNEKIIELIQDKFEIFKTKDIKDIDINKFFVENH